MDVDFKFSDLGLTEEQWNALSVKDKATLLYPYVDAYMFMELIKTEKKKNAKN